MNSSLGNPPLPDSEIETLVASAANYQPDFPRTDIEWGQLIAQRLADQFRRVGGQWYVWEAPCWKAGMDAAWLEAVKGLLAEYGDKARDVLDNGEKLARSLGSARKVRELASMASTDAALQAPSDALDADQNLLNLKNGVLRLDTMELVPHDPSFMLTKLCPVDYDPEATCPTFDKFLQEVQPEGEVRAFLARLFGYALLGDPVEQRFFIFHGSGRNGKSALLDAVLHVLGGYALTADPSTFIMRRDVSGPRGDLVRLKDARLVYTSELGTWPAAGFVDTKIRS